MFVCFCLYKVKFCVSICLLGLLRFESCLYYIKEIGGNKCIGSEYFFIM